MRQGEQQEKLDMDPSGPRRVRKAMGAMVMGLLCLGVFASGAQAASPAWKLLALTGPTNVPPVQSEAQRVTVEAEGGVFKLSVGVGEAKIVDKAYFGTLSGTAGSRVATINGVEGEGASFEVGARVIGGGLSFEGETFVESCSSDCKTPGSTITFSRPAEETTSEEFAIIYSKEANVKEGALPVGAEVRGKSPGRFAPGTTVVSVSGSTITLSQPPASEYFFEEEVAVIGTETTAAVPFNASGVELQGALNALPGPVGSAVSVTGGPGGTAEHPYYLVFGGQFANRNVPVVAVEEGGLIGEHAAAHVFTTVPGGPGTGEISIDPANIGGADTSGEYTVELGPLPEGIVIAAPAQGSNWNCTGEAGARVATCSSELPIRELRSADAILVPIEVTDATEFVGTAPVTISGGEAGSDSFQMPISISSKPADNGIAVSWAGAFNANGEPETQAGAHPFSADTYFMLNTVRLRNGNIVTPGDPRNVIVDLPAGFSGDPLATPRCPQAQLVPYNGEGSELCNADSSVGQFQPVINNFGLAYPPLSSAVFNDVPPRGYAAEFTSLIASPVQSLLASVRNSDYGIRITAPNNPNYARIFGAFAALRGVPTGAAGQAFLTNASDCAENLRVAPVVRTKADTYQSPGLFSFVNEASQPAVTGCDKLEFTPSFGLQPTTTAGSSGTGATATLQIPQGNLLEPTKLAQPSLKKAVVALPAGMSLNASSANGLQACSEEQMGYLGEGELPNPHNFDESAPACPDGSKLGTVKVKTPLLEEELEGTIYLAEQERNPFGSLLALYVAIESPRFGLQIKLAGKVDIDPTTGQLTATFDYNPQVAFEELKLYFRGGGARSELATPEVCGNYKTTGSLEPWSAPESGPPAQINEAGFTVSSGCSASAATRPFVPVFEAGTSDTRAGSFSPLVIKVSRKDGEQELTSLNFTLPKGLLGKLAGIPYCSDAAIAAAQAKTGKAEQASPSCPAASEIGTVDTAAGVGTEPFHVPGKVFLAGPYKGAPISSVIVTPAVAGPFDLGDVVVRAPLYVNPDTTQITAKSDPIPTILKGIPLKLRSVVLNIGRPGFVLNPTSCEPMSLAASMGSSNGATAAPTVRFQVVNCSKLAFKPKLQLSLKGGTKRNGHPALTATLKQRPGQANIGRVVVALPHSEFLAQEHIKTICTRVQFAAKACPKGSIYGRAEALSPLVGYKLSGPVYLRSSDNKLPDLVAALRGPESQPIEIDLDGRIDSFHAGIRNSFEMVPDAPVSKFVLRMQGGKKGLLVNSTDICQGAHKATVKMTGQNGALRNFSSPLKAQCGKKKGKKHRKHKK